MPLSTDQESALDSIMDFLGGTKTEYILTGGPGTGKSFTIKTLLQQIEERSKGGVTVYLTATTNRAASVLAGMCERPAQTIHKLLNLAVKDNYNTGTSSLKKGRRKLNLMARSLIICDEISMADRKLHQIILDYADEFNMKILYVGDQYQLPPVFSVSSVFQHVKALSELTTIHRQGEGSSILYEAAKYREMIKTDTPNFSQIEASSDITRLDKDEFVKKMEEVFQSKEYVLDLDHAKVLAWTNKTVNGYSAHIRNLFYTDMNPVRGEHLIVNASSSKDVPFKTEDTVEVIDVTRGEIHDIPGNFLWISKDDEECRVFLASDFSDVQKLLKTIANNCKKNRNWEPYFSTKELFIDLRSTYASTTHKAQGGSMDIIFIDIDDIGKNTKWTEVARLIYVALTRARHHVYITGELPARLVA